MTYVVHEHILRITIMQRTHIFLRFLHRLRFGLETEKTFLELCVMCNTKRNANIFEVMHAIRIKFSFHSLIFPNRQERYEFILHELKKNDG